MTNEYIRRQDAIDLINKISNLDLKAKGGICVSLANLKKADVAPVVHAHWIDGYKWQTCSKCRNKGKRSWKFCPNCGARMDGKKEG